MVAVRIYVEGGGSTRKEQEPLRNGFAALFAKVLGTRSKPTVIACGPRKEAFNDWKCALSSYPNALCLLLVDSEDAVPAGTPPWDHVRTRKGDGWDKPDGATDDQLHFMVQAMEAWLIADPDALATHYGQGFKRSALPARKDVEAIPKAQLYEALSRATKDTKTKGAYDKSHGFLLIGHLDPNKLRAASKHADRFFATLTAATST
ncbi:DUF4276 family protein [Polyangium aurulentum]|uniref:DUF4276 family protein n=1 Tax=Polyangium aurulentum TaxID=2567896 RepID=UPI00146B8575|nr:DUF4276 family protein [Polyangium aurulentum]UQA59138.1 DUF4276 family protein [Polyangium aurulentum]